MGLGAKRCRLVSRCQGGFRWRVMPDWVHQLASCYVPIPKYQRESQPPNMKEDPATQISERMQHPPVGPLFPHHQILIHHHYRILQTHLKIEHNCYWIKVCMKKCPSMSGLIIRINKTDYLHQGPRKWDFSLKRKNTKIFGAWSLEHVVRPVEPGAVQSEQLQWTKAPVPEGLQGPCLQAPRLHILEPWSPSPSSAVKLIAGAV